MNSPETCTHYPGNGRRCSSPAYAKGLCEKHLSKMYRPMLKPLAGQLRRASQSGARADLTKAEWLDCLDYFYSLGYTCVYCGRGIRVDRISIDHWTPVAMGGGTTVSNCVPACYLCNSGFKGVLTGGEFFSILIDVYKSQTAPKLYANVLKYFEWLKAGSPKPVEDWQGGDAVSVQEFAQNLERHLTL